MKQSFFLDCFTLGPIGCPENLVTTSQPTRSIPKERKPPQYHGGSLSTFISSVCSHVGNIARFVWQFRGGSLSTCISRICSHVGNIARHVGNCAVEVWALVSTVFVLMLVILPDLFNNSAVEAWALVSAVFVLMLVILPGLFGSSTCL